MKMKWYWLIALAVTCCASERPTHYPPPALHPAVRAAHETAKKEKEKDKRPSLPNILKKASIKK